MKRIAFRSTIVIPVIFACHIILFPIEIYIKEINLYLWHRLPAVMFVFFTIPWLSSFPYAKDCKNGGWVEVLFYILPIEIFLFLIFAQWHFLISIVLTASTIITICACRFMLWREAAQDRLSRKRVKRNLMICRRVTLLILAAFLAIPSVMSIFVYNFESPQYEFEQELWNELCGADDDETKSFEALDPLDPDIQLFLCFTQARWEDYSTEEKITLLQKLVDWEAQRLGIPPIKVFSKKLDIFTFGEYERTTNEITIDLEHMDQDSVDTVINTCLHETYHSFQAYVVENTDWESEFSNSYYFQEARSWKDNYSNYIHSLISYDDYASQPLEASAHAFAKEETLLILSNINK